MTITYSCTIFAWSTLRSFLSNVTLQGFFFQQHTCKSVMWTVNPISTVACGSTHSVSLRSRNTSTSSFSGHTLQSGRSLSSKGTRWSDGSLLCTKKEKLFETFTKNTLQSKQGAYLCKHFLHIALFLGQKSKYPFKNKTQIADDSAGMTVWTQP